jgi:hypothetical protein
MAGPDDRREAKRRAKHARVGVLFMGLTFGGPWRGLTGFL